MTVLQPKIPRRVCLRRPVVNLFDSRNGGFQPVFFPASGRSDEPDKSELANPAPRRTEGILDLLGGEPNRSWMQPELAGLGRLPARATLLPYPDVEAARRRDREGSPWFMSLNGDWRFRLAPRPEATPVTFPGLDFDDQDWPACRSPRTGRCMASIGPTTPTSACPSTRRRPPCRRQSDRPLSDIGRDPGGLAEPAHRPARGRGRERTVLLGQRPGGRHGQGQPLPQEFDLTPHVTPGEEALICCAVVKWSDASFVEDQDQWWMGGIHREVFLYCTGRTWIDDVFALATLEGDLRDGRLAVTAKLGFLDAPSDGWNVRVTLFDDAGREASPSP